MRFGELHLDIIDGGRYRIDGDAVFGVVPKALWERRYPPDAENRVRLASNCLLVRRPGYAALVGTGIGTARAEGMRGRYAIEEGPGLADALGRAGIRAEEVDAVVLSRLHFDHAGGASRREGGRSVPKFPNAALYVQAEELNHARVSGDRALYRPEDWEPYAESARLEPIEGEREIRPGLTVVPLPGHEARMQAVRVHSGGRTAFYFADALPTSAHVPIPWVMASDAYPVEMIQNKKQLIDRAVREEWLCVFERDPDVPWGTIVDEASGRRRVHVVPRDREEF